MTLSQIADEIESLRNLSNPMKYIEFVSKYGAVIASALRDCHHCKIAASPNATVQDGIRSMEAEKALDTALAALEEKQ